MSKDERGHVWSNMFTKCEARQEVLDECSKTLCQKNCSCVDLNRLQELQEVQASGICRQSAHQGGKVLGCTLRLPYPPEEMPGTHFI